MSGRRALSRARLTHLFVALSLANSLACQDKAAAAEAFSGAPVRSESREGGLEIAIMREGSGHRVEIGDTVTIHYRSATANGQRIGSAEGRELTFVVGRDPNLVDGLQTGVQGMTVGELRRITVPPALAYRGRADMGFPPDANLVFSVELKRQTPRP